MTIKTSTGFVFVIMCLSFLSACKPSESTVKITSLTCENQDNPQGIHFLRPHFSWIMESQERGQRQSAYQILVSASAEMLAENMGDIWNSGKKKSNQSVLIEYAGSQPVSGTTYFWKVRVWDKDGRLSDWSSTARWSTGLLNTEDWKADWIGIDKAFPGEDAEGQFRKLAARYLRKEFEVNKPVRKAVTYVSGLGLYELRMNGSKTGNLVLAPGATDYTKTVFYNTYDVTSLLVTGKNVIGVILGNGRYFAMRKDEPFLMHNYGFPRLLLQMNIEYADGTKDRIVSDESWKLTVHGPITENNEFDGEKYDATKEMNGWDKAGFNPGEWTSANLVEAPSGVLTGQLNEPIRVTGEIKPVSFTSLNPGVYIYDMGQNMVGWASLKVKGKRGDKVSLRFAESLRDDGSLYLENIRSARVTDTYVLKGGDEETWQPKFTYHGFRYVELTCPGMKPDLSTITGCVVNNDLASNGTFECSDTLINTIYKNAMWGIRGNYRSFPTDCPQRDERMGWLGDRATGCRGESYIFKNGGLYRKWLGDMRDAQNEQGGIPDVCPAYWAMYNDNVTWDGTGIMVMDMLLSQYGDVTGVRENYDAMKKWMMYMHGKYGSDDLMPRDSYGDWCMPPEEMSMIHSRDPKRITAGTLLGTSFFIHDLDLMQKFAKLLSRTDDVATFHDMAARMKNAYNENFFDPEGNYYGNNTVTANILSLAFDLVPTGKREDVFNSAVEQIETVYHGHIPTGLIGIMVLQRVLTDFGRADIAMRFATETTYPGWGYMAENGATTIWELWNGNTADPSMNSGNHVMLLGDLIIWMHEYLAGIKPGEPGFKSMIMKPLVGAGISFVKATHRSPYGTIVSNWNMNENNDFTWDIQVPVNTSAKVYVPANNRSSVLENGQKPSTSNGVTFTGIKDGFAIYTILSGTYHFESKEVKIPVKNYNRSATVDISPDDMSIDKKIQVTLHCDDSEAEIRYTLDGSEPDGHSMVYSKPFEMMDPGRVRARSFKQDLKPGYVTERNYDIYNSSVNGLHYSYYEGQWDSIPDFSTLKPLKSGKVNGFKLSPIKSIEDYWGICFKGIINIPRDGTYVFSTLSDDGSRLSVDGKVVVNNDGIHGPFSVKGKIELTSGRHPIKLDYFEGNYGEMLRLEIEGPGLPRQSLPVYMLSFD